MRRPPPFVLTAPSEKERAQQIDCTEMLEKVLRPEVAWTAIDHSQSFNPTLGRNGRPIGLMEMARRKAQGVRPGIPDYNFVDAGRSYWIEFKIDDNDLDPDQKVFMRRLIAAGAICKVCWGAIQVMNTVYGWGLCRSQVKWRQAS